MTVRTKSMAALEWIDKSNEAQSDEGKRNAIAKAQVYATLAVAQAIADKK